MKVRGTKLLRSADHVHKRTISYCVKDAAGKIYQLETGVSENKDSSHPSVLPVPVSAKS